MPWFTLFCVIAAGSAQACSPLMQRRLHNFEQRGLAERTAVSAWQELDRDALACSRQALRLSILPRLAKAAQLEEQPAIAMASLTEWLNLARLQGAKVDLLQALRALGSAKLSAREFADAEQHLLEANAVAADLADVYAQADISSELARLYRGQVRYLQALRVEQTALGLRRQLHPPYDIWRSAWSLAVLYEQLELPEQSLQAYRQALDAVEQSGDAADVGSVLSSFAGFLNDFGNEEALEALQMASRAVEIFEKQAVSTQFAGAHLQVGRALLGLGRWEAAQDELKRALAIAKVHSFSNMQAHILFRLGDVAMAQKDLENADDYYRQADALYTANGNVHRLMKLHKARADLARLRGDALDAAEHGLAYFRLRSELLSFNTSRELADLLTDVALADERYRVEGLEQQAALTKAQLEATRGTRLAIVAFSALLATLAGLLFWRQRRTQRLVETLSAQQGALEVANEKLRANAAELYQRATTDVLTQISNRLFALEKLSTLLEGDQRRDLVAILLDIDHFKRVNDDYGHLVGDQVLQYVARSMSRVFSGAAVIARYGGEEFLVVLENSNVSSALFRTELLRRHLREHPFQLEQGPEITITISAGIADPRRLDALSLQTLLGAADRALYAAKDGGRDTTRIAEAG